MLTTFLPYNVARRHNVIRQWPRRGRCVSVAQALGSGAVLDRLPGWCSTWSACSSAVKEAVGQLVSVTPENNGK